MTLPFISAITLQYGDVPQLEDSLACFLAQDYEGESEIVILNSFPRQRLHYDHPKVRIVNLDTRPPSLADCRNVAIEHARGEIMVTWDSDDAFAPWYLSTIAKYFGDGQWAWLDKQFFLVGWKIKSIVPGSMNSLIFTKDAWKTVGGYHSGINVGEDRQFVGKITHQTIGKRVELPPEEIAFFYSWGEANVHISGFGDDRPGRMSSYERTRINVEKRAARKLVPVGDIALNPAMKRDYGAMAKAFVGKSKTPSGTKAEVVVVLLGRYGDVINALPILRHIAESYAKPHLVISREFASLLEGISYVEPHPVDLPYDQLGQATKIAEKLFKHVIVLQPWGKGWNQPKLTEAYNKETWRQAGFLNKFDDPTWFPVFDRRNLAREEALCAKLGVFGKPMLLVKLDGGISSPCRECPKLMPVILENFGDNFNVINLSTVKAERVFDLVTLFSRASALVSVDTSLLHLAGATAIPFVALVNPQPWLGTVPRGQCVRRMTYTEALANPTAVIEALQTAVMSEHKEMAVVEMRQPPKRRLFHCVERHSGKTERRKREAWQSWDRLYADGVVPCHLKQYPRNARAIGDRRELSYLKDVLKVAMDQSGDADVIMFTNDDVGLHPDLPELLLFHVPIYGACASFRCEFNARVTFEGKTPEMIATGSKRCIGQDLFAFTKAWLTEHWERIPDFILGASAWDWWMTCFIRKEKGITATRSNIESPIWPAEIPLGYVAHQRHKPLWNTPQYSNSPAEQHNKKLFQDWLSINLPEFWRPAQPLKPQHKRKVITVRRTAAIGDALAATCVASALRDLGCDVRFQSDPVIHPVLRRLNPPIEILAPTSSPDVDLDGAYESHAHRTTLHFADIFTETANRQLRRLGLNIPNVINFAPRLRSDPILRERTLNELSRFPKPWVMICPRSNSWINRTVPDETWRQAATMMIGTKFWLGTHGPAPDGIIDLRCRDLDLLVEYIGCADLLVTVDTGPMHIAAAIGTPIVVIEQQSSPEHHLSDQRDFIVIRPTKIVD